MITFAKALGIVSATLALIWGAYWAGLVTSRRPIEPATAWRHGVAYHIYQERIR